MTEKEHTYRTCKLKIKPHNHYKNYDQNCLDVHVVFVSLFTTDMKTNITCIYEIRYMNKRCNAQHFFSLLPCTTIFNSNS